MEVLNVIVIGFAFLILVKSTKSNEILLAQDEEIYDIVNCINQIMLKNYAKGSEVTFIDLSDSKINHDILIELHRILHVSVISRTTKERLSITNEGYIVYAKKASDFVGLFKYLTKEATWNPHAKFIVVGDLKNSELIAIFEIFLEYHVFNVVIVNGIHDINLYTYNPFENYGCGRKFHRIIDYGKCDKSSDMDLFPNKLETGLKNCTVNIAAPHWPPYIINPNTNISKRLGIEQFVFQIISEIEQFTTNYTYTNDGENFTFISDEMSAVGPLNLLQQNKADVIFGGMMLIRTRADVFDYLYSHLAFVDEMKLMVKKAGTVPPWKNVYLEFEPVVWFLLVITFLLYFLFLILIFRENDKISILLKMWDCLFVHGQTLSNKRAVKCAFIMWIWFTYLVNSFYQSNMVSLSTHPAKDYQISNEQDLENNHLKPCISKVIQTFMWIELGMPLVNITDDCRPLLQSILTVAERDNFYTITAYSLFSYNRHKFVDKYGNSRLYEFPTLNKIMYAMYFYKGFPLLHKFHTYTLRLRENGLIEKVSKDLDYEKMIKYYYSKESMRFQIAVPWCIYLFGAGLAIFVFVIEIIQINRNMTNSNVELQSREFSDTS